MAKIKKVFLCSNCGAGAPKWAGQCSACKEWNTLAEQQQSTGSAASARTHSVGSVLDFSPGVQQAHAVHRVSTGVSEFDRVLGGGFLSDALTLIVGNPGIGKSTLALQVALFVAQQTPEKDVLICSGEESVFQIQSRAERLGKIPSHLKIAHTVSLEDIIATCAKEQPQLLVVDSVQTIGSKDLPNIPGSLPQIRTVTERLMHACKSQAFPLFLVGQVNKDGDMAGPQTLAHLVDVVLQFEGEEGNDLRILRALKNRFGSSDEVGILQMTPDFAKSHCDRRNENFNSEGTFYYFSYPTVLSSAIM